MAEQHESREQVGSPGPQAPSSSHQPASPPTPPPDGGTGAGKKGEDGKDSHDNNSTRPTTEPNSVSTGSSQDKGGEAGSIHRTSSQDSLASGNGGEGTQETVPAPTNATTSSNSTGDISEETAGKDKTQQAVRPTPMALSNPVTPSGSVDRLGSTPDLTLQANSITATSPKEPAQPSTPKPVAAHEHPRIARLQQPQSSRELLSGSVVVTDQERAAVGKDLRADVSGKRDARGKEYARGLRAREAERQRRMKEKGVEKARKRWKTVRTALRIHAMALVRAKKLENEKTEIMARAEEKGIELDPSKFSQVCVWERGEVKFYSKENLCKRKIAKHDTRLMPIVELWWGLAMTNVLTGGPPGAVTKDEYLAIHDKLYRALIRPYDAESARVSGQEDWEQDAPDGDNELDLYSFQESLLGIADIWTATTSADEYAQFLLHLWDKVTTSRGSRPTWRDDDDIYPSDDEDEDGVFDNLFDAVEAENYQEVKRLLIAGEDPSEQGKYGLTPLHNACIKNNALIARLLVEHGANTQIRDRYGMTPLHHCASVGSTKCTKVLLDTDVDTHVVDNEGHTAYDMARRSGNDDVAGLLADNIFRAIRTRNFEAVQSYVEENPQVVRALDPKKNTPLHIDAQVGHVPIAEYLHQHGSDLEALNKEGRTAFWVAVKRGHLELARFLHGLDAQLLTIQDCDGVTPLQIACDNANLEMVELLLSLGADIHTIDKHGMTALHYSARAGSMECTSALLRAGADVTTKTKSGRTAWTYAKEHKWGKLAAMIVPTSGPSIRGVTVELCPRGPALPNESPHAHCYVTLSGSRLRPVDHVTLNGVRLTKFIDPVASETDNVTFIVNQWPAPSTGNLEANTITLTSQGSTSPLWTEPFTFLNKPEVWSAGPNHTEDMEGNLVLRGRNFFGNALVRLGGMKAANVLVKDSTTLSCYVPPSSGAVPRHILVEIAGITSTVLEKELPWLRNQAPQGERLMGQTEQLAHMKTQIKTAEPTYITPNTPTTEVRNFQALKGATMPRNKKAMGGGYARWAYEPGRAKLIQLARTQQAEQMRRDRKAQTPLLPIRRGQAPMRFDQRESGRDRVTLAPTRRYAVKSVTATHVDRCRQEGLPPPSSRGSAMAMLLALSEGDARLGPTPLSNLHRRTYGGQTARHSFGSTTRSDGGWGSTNGGANGGIASLHRASGNSVSSQGPSGSQSARGPGRSTLAGAAGVELTLPPLK